MMSAQMHPERMQIEPGVHEKEGKWYMRLDERSDGVEIPRDMANVMRAALWMERHRESSEVVKRSLADIDCHQTAFFAIGLLSAEGMHERYPYDASLFRKNEYWKAKNVDDLTNRIQSALGDRLGLVQAVREDYLPLTQQSFRAHVGHSFLAGFDTLGRGVCFEKVNPGLPFKINSLRNIYGRYAYGSTQHLWAAKVLEDIDDTEGAQRARAIFKKKSTLK